MAPSSHGPEALLRAMAPIDKVLDAFIFSIPGESDSCSWAQPEVGQVHFATLVSRVIAPPFVPTRRYLRLLLTRYASRMERESGYQVEDETLAELIAEHAFGPPPSSTMAGSAAGCGMGGGDAPDPDANGYVSFQLPQQDSNNVIGIRVYPHHNDVGIRRVWEAGACLAEFLLSHPDLIRDKKVIELGAGVGLTGIVAAGLCRPMHLHMTDYTEACLDNMEHNISVNEDWLHRQGVNVDCDESCRKLTSGYLEWTECSECDSENITVDTPTSVPFKISEAHILLAADVVYDVIQIPALVRCVKVLLSSSRDAKAIFATTFRNEKTFALFTNQLHNEGIVSQFVDKEVMENLPVPSIFPCYFPQPRSDIRICTCTMTIG